MAVSLCPCRDSGVTSPGYGYLSLQSGSIQDGDPWTTAGPCGIFQAQQRANGPWAHSQAHGGTLQVPGNPTYGKEEYTGQ